MSPRAALPAVLLALGCTGGPTAPPPTPFGGGVPLAGGSQVAGAALDLRAFAAELAFTMPEESREVLRALQRTEMARLEADRLGLVPPADLVQERLEAFEAELRGSLEGEGDGTDPLEDWSRGRYDRSWSEVRLIFARHLEDNLRYRLALRAAASEVPRLRLIWLVARDEATAAGWARSVGAGRDPKTLLGESLLPPPLADGSWPPLPVWEAGPLGPDAAAARAGDLLGPLRLEGDASWRVAFVLEVLPPQAGVPPLSVLLAGLEERPIDPLEARSWFEAMAGRYTAEAVLPDISAPSPAFVPLR